MPAAKENRNGSRGTLPLSSIDREIEDEQTINYNQENYNQGKEDMSEPSRELEQDESALQSVVNSLIDSQEALRKIGDELEDESLKHYFLAESLKRAQFRGEIEAVLHRQGVHDIKESGTTAGTVHRAWADLKAKLGGGDHTLLATAEQGEDAATEAYGKAIQSDLPLPIRQLLTSQAAHVGSSHDFIKAARDQRAE
ncbi:MAG TPA: PA2169 family four-helix-bundle protein [Terracidiphilus sp.]